MPSARSRNIDDRYGSCGCLARDPSVIDSTPVCRSGSRCRSASSPQSRWSRCEAGCASGGPLRPEGVRAYPRGTYGADQWRCNRRTIGQALLVLGAATQESLSAVGAEPACRDEMFEQETSSKCRVRRVPLGMRACTGCGLIKPLEHFRPRSGNTYRKKTRAACRESAWKPKGERHQQHEQGPERTCTECGLTKPIDAFLRIRSIKTGVLGRCRTCRNARARERYHSKVEIRTAEIARSSRNPRARRLRERSPT